jgi:hypothetical protein
MQGNIQKVINNNQEWADVREGFRDFPPNYHPEKSIELINCCRASPKLRQLYPYSSLGRLGIWRYNPMEAGFADWFLCMYFTEGKYYVCTYDNTKRVAFDTAETAIAFFEQHLHIENPLG